jgi:cytoskeletal protein CcmA (bactofilin family)
VRSPRVVIADGAFFKGKVEMGGEKEPSPPVQKQLE